MALFPRSSNTDRPASRAEPAPGDGALSIVALGMTITGDIETVGIVKVEGTIAGSIRSARQVLVGRQGIIHGDVRAGEVVVGGAVHGNIAADDRVEIEGAAHVEGDIHTRSIVVQEGGRINGSVRMSEPAAPGEHDGDSERGALALTS